MTGQPTEEKSNAFTWDQAAFIEARTKAIRTVQVGEIDRYVEDVTRRCARDDQMVGAMVLSGLAAFCAVIRARKQRISRAIAQLAAAMLYREITNVQGPFRVMAVYDLLMPGNEKGMSPRLDPKEFQELRAEAQRRLMLNPDPAIKQWLEAVAHGHLPYGWEMPEPERTDGLARRH